MAGRGWPARLREGPVTVRPLRVRDAGAWAEVRRRNVDWLRPWEATPPGVDAYDETVATYVAMLRELRRQARRGTAYPFAVAYDDRLVGQVTISNVVRGSLNSASAGYWVDEHYAGRGVIPTALALVVDHLFDAGGLHRVEANVRPENAASRRVLDKLGFQEEGLRRHYLHIAGRYRDHLCYALVREDVPEGVLRRWRQVRGGSTSR